MLFKNVPQRIKEYCEETIRIKKIAPSSFARQIRKCLEVLCNTRKIKQGTLFNQLEKLANNGEIPNHFTEMVNILRFLGNIGAYSTEINIRSLSVDTIDDFFTAVIEYVYDFSIRIEEIKKVIKNINRKINKKLILFQHALF